MVPAYPISLLSVLIQFKTLNSLNDLTACWSVVVSLKYFLSNGSNTESGFVDMRLLTFGLRIAAAELSIMGKRKLQCRFDSHLRAAPKCKVKGHCQNVSWNVFYGICVKLQVPVMGDFISHAENYRK